MLKHKREIYENNYLRYDTAASLRNRFTPDKRRERQHPIIRPIQDKIEKVLSSENVLYSMSADKIYKIAVFDSTTNQYWRIEASSENSFNNIQFSDMHKSFVNSYSGFGSTSEILALVKKYEQNNELKWGYIRLKQLVEKMIECNDDYRTAA